MKPIVVTVGPLATADADGICASQTPTDAFDIDGALASDGVATLDVARRVLFTFAGADAGKTVTLTGTDYQGLAQSETIAAVSASTAQSVLDYKTVTAISISAGAAGAIQVGTNGVASSPIIPLDYYGRPEVSLQINVTGTVNYTVSQTVQSPYIDDKTDLVWVNHPDANLVAATATKQGNYAYVPAAVRVTLNSGTGSIQLIVLQSGITG